MLEIMLAMMAAAAFVYLMNLVILEESFYNDIGNLFAAYVVIALVAILIAVFSMLIMGASDPSIISDSAATGHVTNNAFFEKAFMVTYSILMGLFIVLMMTDIAKDGERKNTGEVKKMGCTCGHCGTADVKGKRRFEYQEWLEEKEQFQAMKGRAVILANGTKGTIVGVSTEGSWYEADCDWLIEVKSGNAKKRYWIARRNLLGIEEDDRDYSSDCSEFIQL